MSKKEMVRLRDIVLNTKVTALEELRNSFAVSDMEIHIKSLMIELIDYRLTKHNHLKASLIVAGELREGEV